MERSGGRITETSGRPLASDGNGHCTRVFRNSMESALKVQVTEPSGPYLKVYSTLPNVLQQKCDSL